MRGIVVSSGVCAGLLALSAQGHVQPYYAPVPISADALAADPALANFETWDLHVSVTPTPGSTGQDRFQVATLDALLSQGSFYSPVGGGDIPVVATTANLNFDTYVTVPFFSAGMDPKLIPIPGSSDVLNPHPSNVAIFPRAGEQKSQLSVTWGTFNPTLYTGDYTIARLTVSKDATGPLAGYVLSLQTNNLSDQNFATLSFNNGALIAASGSEFALLGDANHDNKVNTADFAALGQHFNQSSTWTGGDFNGDGRTNAMDFNALATNFGTNSGAPALGALVPEPMMIASGVAMFSLHSLRRRRRS